MSRIRNVKPAYFQHERVYEAEVATGLPIRLAYIGLWTQADRRGLFRWRPRMLKVNILPYDDVDFGAILDALEKHGFIVRYEVGGEAFGRIPTFAKHQRPHVREVADPGIPLPQSGPSTTKVVPEHNLGDARHAGDGDGDGEWEGVLTTPVSPSAPQPKSPEPLDPVKALSIDLAVRAGEPADLAAKAVAELIADGVPLECIRSRVDEIREPIGVWPWKHAVLAGWKTSRPKAADHGPKSPSSNGAVVAKIASERARAAADLAAFEASGCATRSEYLAQKARLA